MQAENRLPLCAEAEHLLHIVRELLTDEGPPVAAAVTPVQVKEVACRGHENREIILDGHLLRDAAEKPVGICPRQAMQQDQGFRRAVIVPGISDLCHLNVIGQDIGKVRVLHDALGMKLHSSACHNTAFLSFSFSV